MIWQRDFTLASLNAGSVNTLVAHLGIEYTVIGDDYLQATMPVDSRTHQPMGLLHGGASVVLAETLGSVAGNMCVPRTHCCVGLDINANHLRAKRNGIVTGIARPVHLGATTQVWQINLQDEREHLLCTSRLTLAVLSQKKRTVRQ
ncbi:hotdog fold thioesterase [Tolumonas auensis]|uniref:hotdog fold thioesterase n=1 Tax=Tolumonas auensis TaxID=43948 RepID=UPI002AA7F002|nr:hotdog fold thioesterase [Tolumonas auensis]